MQIFNLTLNQMLMMFTLILVGFVIRKKGNLSETADTTMAKLETLIFTPAISLFALMSKCTVETFTENASLILYGLIITLAVIVVAYPVSRLFVRSSKSSSEAEYQSNIYKYALSFGNYGFMGNFIVLGIWGTDMFYQYSLFTLFVGILCLSWGMYVLIPKEKNAGMLHNLKKSLLTPPIIAQVAGVLCGLLGVAKFVPQFVLDALDSAGNCQGPVAMVLAGFVIGGYNLKELVCSKKVYVVTFLRLVVIPAVIILALKLLGASDTVMILALITFATPVGLNVIVFPAAYGGDTKTGASMAMISHTLSVITIPLMYLVFIELL